MAKDLTHRLHIKDVDGSELRFLLMSQIPGGVLHRGKNEDVLYGAGAEQDYVLRLSHKKNDAVYRAEAGPALTEETLHSLAQRIETELKEPNGALVGRELLLSESPIEGYFRHDDRLQILPAPSDAPRSPVLPGISARHPFVLEVQYLASKNPAINTFRRLLVISQFELALTSFLRDQFAGQESQTVVSGLFLHLMTT